MSVDAMLLFHDGPDIDRVRVATDEHFRRFVDWVAELKRDGKLVAVDPLRAGGHTVRRRGATIVVDGPYAEGREAVLGYLTVRVADIEEACRIAGTCPHTDVGGATEVRLIGSFPRP